MTRPWTLTCLLLAAAASACSAPPTLMGPSGQSTSFQVLALSPAVGETLSRGAAASITLTVVSDSPGRLTVSLRDQAGAAVVSPETSVELVAGVPTSLQVWFAVPSAAEKIEVRADFRPAAAVAAPTLLQVEYVVR
jgi:hypothetical protein